MGGRVALRVGRHTGRLDLPPVGVAATGKARWGGNGVLMADETTPRRAGTHASASGTAVSAGTIRYRPDIDGIRAVSILGVVGYHAFPVMVSGGFAGVDVFFVISGFLISTIILEHLETGRFSFAGFYARRVRRLFPALLTMVAVVLMSGWWISLSGEYSRIGGYASSAIGFALNITIFNRMTHYFEPVLAYVPLIHLWSLGLEEQFYLFWPLILFFLKRNVGFTVPTIFLISCSFLYNIYFVNGFPEASFYLLPGRTWQLLLGAWLAHWCLGDDPVQAWTRRLRCRWPNILGLTAGDIRSLLGIGMIIGTFGLLAPTWSYPGWWALLPTIGALLLISAGPNGLVNRTALSHPAAVFIGRISYPLYLWHWPLLAFDRVLSFGSPGLIERGVCLLLATWLSWLTWRFIETPIRRAQGYVPLLGLAVAALVLFAAGTTVYLQQGFPGRAIEAEARRIAAPGPSVAASQYEGIFDSYPVCTGRLVSSGPQNKWCHTTRPGMPRYAIYGDSHAAQYFPGLAAVDQANWLNIGQPGCPPLQGVEIHGTVQGIPCVQRVDSALETLVANRDISTVALSFFAAFYLSDTRFAPDQIGPKDPALLWMSERGGAASVKPRLVDLGLRRTVQMLRKGGKRVVIILDSPEMLQFPEQCVPRRPFAASPPACVVSRQLIEDQRQGEYRRMVAAIASDFPGVRVFDPLDALCDARECRMIVARTLLYRDCDHLAIPGSRLVAARFAHWLHESE